MKFKGSHECVIIMKNLHKIPYNMVNPLNSVFNPSVNPWNSVFNPSVNPWNSVFNPSVNPWNSAFNSSVNPWNSAFNPSVNPWNSAFNPSVIALLFQECLNIFGSSSLPGVTTSLKMAYEGMDTRLCSCKYAVLSVWAEETSEHVVPTRYYPQGQ